MNAADTRVWGKGGNTGGSGGVLRPDKSVHNAAPRSRTVPAPRSAKRESSAAARTAASSSSASAWSGSETLLGTRRTASLRLRGLGVLLLLVVVVVVVVVPVSMVGRGGRVVEVEEEEEEEEGSWGDIGERVVGNWDGGVRRGSACVV
jgi:hypothetical protein